MTRSRQAYLERKSREDIAAQDRKSKEDIAAKDRAQKGNIEKAKLLQKESSEHRDRIVDVFGHTVGSIARVAGKMNPLNLYTMEGSGVAELIGKIPSDFNYSFKYTGVPGVTNVNDPTQYTQVFAATLADTIGYLGNNPKDNPINISGITQQTQLRDNNSRIDQYDPGDLLQVELATLSVYEHIMHAKKTLACFNVINGSNFNLRRQLINACGWYESDIVTHIKDYRAQLNLIIKDFNIACKLPKALSLAVRKDILYSNIILDGKETNRQMLVLRPAYIHYYNELSAVLGIYNIPNCTDFGVYLAKIRECLQVLKESNVLVTMYADIAAAVNNNIYTIEPITADELPSFIVSSDIGDQIRNATILPLNHYILNKTWWHNSVDIDNAFKVYQDTDGWLTPRSDFSQSGTKRAYTIKLTTSTAAEATKIAKLMNNAILNLSRDNVLLNIDDTSASAPYLIEPFLLKCTSVVALAVTTSPYTVELSFNSVATEVMLDFLAYQPQVVADEEGDTDSRFLDTVSALTQCVQPFATDTDIKTVAQASLSVFPNCSAFGYCPITYIASSNPNGVGFADNPVTDVHNLFIVPKQNVEFISRLASTSLFLIADYSKSYKG